MTYEEAIMNDPLVYSAYHYKIPLERLVAELVAQKNALMDEIAKLKAIAPMKIRTPDGGFLVYRCPIEHIPEIGGHP